VFVVVLGYDPLHVFLIKLTDRVLFQKKIDYQKVLMDASAGISKIKSLHHLLNLVVHFVTMRVQVRSAAVLIFDEKEEHVLARGRFFAVEGTLVPTMRVSNRSLPSEVNPYNQVPVLTQGCHYEPQGMEGDESHIIRPGSSPPLVFPTCARCRLPVERFTIDPMDDPYRVGIHAECCGQAGGKYFTVDELFWKRRHNKPIVFFD